MRCLLQTFDDAGRPRLDGGSNFKDHIGWLPVMALSLDGRAPTGPGANGASNPQFRDIRFVIRVDTRAAPQLQNALTYADWAKAVLDCFKDGDNQAWYLRLTLPEPGLASLEPKAASLGGDPLLKGALEFAQVSIDYRDPGASVGTFMRSGAVWDPDQQGLPAVRSG
jgi:type VI protein secretion system component Hcp